MHLDEIVAMTEFNYNTTSEPELRYKIWLNWSLIAKLFNEKQLSALS